MNFDDKDRDPFEMFGEPETLTETRAQEIDLDAIEAEARAAKARKVLQDAGFRLESAGDNLFKATDPATGKQVSFMVINPSLDGRL